MKEATKVQDTTPPGRAAVPTADRKNDQLGGNRPAQPGPDFASWIMAERWFSLLLSHGLVFWLVVFALVNPWDLLARGAVLLGSAIVVALYWLINWSWYKVDRTWFAIRKRNRRR